MKNQPITSKYTSINSSKLPRVYNHVDWSQLKYDKFWANGPFEEYTQFGNPLIVYDYGCGRYPDAIGDYFKTMGIRYVGYDPYWFPDGYRNYPEEGYGFPNADVFICSNVLNVICSWTEVKRISYFIRNQHRPFFITAYEGDKTGRGKETKKDCWQWNKLTPFYLFNPSDRIKKKIITDAKYLSYVK